MELGDYSRLKMVATKMWNQCSEDARKKIQESSGEIDEEATACIWTAKKYLAQCYAASGKWEDVLQQHLVIEDALKEFFNYKESYRMAEGKTTREEIDKELETHQYLAAAGPRVWAELLSTVYVSNIVDGALELLKREGAAKGECRGALGSLHGSLAGP